MLEALQKLIPWVTGLPALPKLAITAIWLLVSFTFMYLVWVPPLQVSPADTPAVQEAYARLSRTLLRLKRLPNGRITVDGQPVDIPLEHYYSDYIAISEFIAAHPNDLKGVYEEIWGHGGEGRSYINDTQSFEAVVRAFFSEYRAASQPKQKIPLMNQPD